MIRSWDLGAEPFFPIGISSRFFFPCHLRSEGGNILTVRKVDAKCSVRSFSAYVGQHVGTRDLTVSANSYCNVPSGPGKPNEGRPIRQRSNGLGVHGLEEGGGARTEGSRGRTGLAAHAGQVYVRHTFKACHWDTHTPKADQMSTSQHHLRHAQHRLRQIASEWPADPLRPNLQLKTFLAALADHPALSARAVAATKVLHQNQVSDRVSSISMHHFRARL